MEVCSNFDDWMMSGFDRAFTRTMMLLEKEFTQILLLREFDLNNKLANLQLGNPDQYCAYGDGIFQDSPCLV
jgi:hypothetical protein